MNRLLKLDELVLLYRLPRHVQEELVASIKPVEQDDQGVSLFLEAQADAWLTGRYAGPCPKQQDDEFLTTREVACLLRCSYREARDRLLNGPIKAIRDGRWLRTRRAWVEEYIASRTWCPSGTEGAATRQRRDQAQEGRNRRAVLAGKGIVGAWPVNRDTLTPSGAVAVGAVQEKFVVTSGEAGQPARHWCR